MSSAVLAVLVCVLWALPPLPATATEPVLAPPVEGPVLRGFDASTRFGPGHRGVDLGAAPGTAVRASAAGTVTFAGFVAGVRWVTVDHGPVRTTVGPLASVAVARGGWVARGATLGRSGTAHGRPAVHWSARRGDRYVDPRSVGRRLVASLVPSPTTTWHARPPTAHDGGHRRPAGVR